MIQSLAGARVLVTGGAGFLGSHLVEALQAREVAEVVAPRSRETDLRDPRATDALFADCRPDVVLHLAATVGGIGANQRWPGTFFRDNMAMGLNVLEAARVHGTAKVVVTGTVCSYPKHTPVPFAETALFDGYPEETNAPYGIAKRALLVMAQAYRQEFGCDFVVVLPANLYGPRDHFDLETSHVIPAMIRKLLDAGDEPVVLWGDGSPTREFLYVEDAAEGILRAAERYGQPEPLNLGTGEETSIRELVGLVAAATGFSGEVVWDTSRPNGQPRRALDVSRARRLLGLQPATTLADGIARTVAWYRSHRQEADA